MSGGCEFAWESDGFAWVLPGGGLISVNGDTGPAVLLDAGDIPSTGPSTVQADLDALKPITSQAELEARFPNVAGVHTIDSPTRFEPPPGGGDIVLLAGRSVVGVFPGSIDSSGGVITTLQGDFAGPLVSGECPIANFRIRNINAGGSDVRLDSLAGRVIIIDNVELASDNPGVIENMLGSAAFETLSLNPATSAGTGLVIDGVIVALAFYEGQCVAPGTNPYTGWTVTATCTVVVVVAWLDVFAATVLPADAMVFIDPAATLPTSPSPTRELGVRVTGAFVRQPGVLFANGSLTHRDIRIYAAGNINGSPSRFLGDIVMDVSGGTPATLSHSGLPAGTLQVVPPQNPGPTAALTLQTVSERHTLTVVSAAVPYRWRLRFDGPNNGLAGGSAWSGEIARNGGGTPTVEGFVQVKTFSGTGSTSLLVADLGVAGAAPDGTYTITINGTDFDEPSVAQTFATVITNLRSTVDLGAEPVITAQSDAAEAMEIRSTTGAVFTYSSSGPSPFDLWDTPLESKGVIGELRATRSNVAGSVRLGIDSGEEFRVAMRTDTPATATDVYQMKLLSEGLA